MNFVYLSFANGKLFVAFIVNFFSVVMLSEVHWKLYHVVV